MLGSILRKSVLIILPFLFVACSDVAYEGITWSSDGIVGVNELDLDNSRKTHYYLFKRSFVGTLEEIQEVRIPTPQEDAFAIRGWRPTDALKEGLISYQLLTTSGTPETDPNAASMVHGKPGPTGVLVYYTTAHGVLRQSPRDNTMAILYANTAKARDLRYQGLEGTPISDRFHGTHGVRGDLENGLLKTEIRLDENGKPFDPYFIFPGKIEYSYENGKVTSKKAFDSEGKPTTFKINDCHEIKSKNGPNGVTNESCFDKEGNAIVYSSSDPYHQAQYTYAPDHELIQYLDKEGNPAYGSDNQDYTDLKRTGLPAQGEVTVEYLNRKGEKLPEVNRIKTVMGPFNELLEYSCWNKDKPTSCEAGWHKHTRKYENGFIVESAYYDKEGKLFEEDDLGFARRTWKRNEANIVTEIRSYNAEDKLAGKPNMFAPVYVTKYSEGRLSEVRFLDSEEKPTSHPDRDTDYAIVKFKYPEPTVRERCLFDEKEKAYKEEGSGHSCERALLNEHKWPIQFSFFDGEMKPVAHPTAKYHSQKIEWDDRGYLTTIKYLDKEDKPIHIGQVSIHEVRLKHTTFGATSEEAFFDKDGNPAENGLGTHKTERYYKDGRYFQAKLYDKNGRLKYTFDY
tara:strand:+ start:37234 stop:39105 length:1872 start_codon:yes stop_codon:yes gene_type:complete